MDRISQILAESLVDWEVAALVALARDAISEHTPAVQRLVDLRLAEPLIGNGMPLRFRVTLLGQSVLALIRQSGAGQV